METHLKLCFLLLSFTSLIHAKCDDLVFCDEEYETDQNENLQQETCDDPVFCEEIEDVELDNREEECTDPVFCGDTTDYEDDCLSINEIDDQVFSTEVR